MNLRKVPFATLCVVVLSWTVESALESAISSYKLHSPKCPSMLFRSHHLIYADRHLHHLSYGSNRPHTFLQLFESFHQRSGYR